MELKVGGRYLVSSSKYTYDTSQEIKVLELSPSKKFAKISRPNYDPSSEEWRETEEILNLIVEELEDDASIEKKIRVSGFDIDHIMCPECLGIRKSYSTKCSKTVADETSEIREFILIKCDKCNYLIGMVEEY